MIRKTIIVVLTLAALGIGVLGVQSWAFTVGQQLWKSPRHNVFLYSRDAIARLMWIESTAEIELDFEHGTDSDRISFYAEVRYFIPLGSAETLRKAGVGFHEIVWRRKHPRGPRTSTGPNVYYSLIRCPTWTASAACLVYPTFAFIRGPLRRHRRRKCGLCVTCGYDLRGSPDRCPECATEIESA